MEEAVYTWLAGVPMGAEQSKKTINKPQGICMK